MTLLRGDYMDLLGIISKIDGDEAEVQIKRVSGCGGNCEHCGGSCESAFHGLKVKNTIDAKVGETVKIEFKESESMKASLIIYLIPLAGFLIGLLGAFLMNMSEMNALLAAVIGLLIGFFVIHLSDKRYKKNNILATIKKFN